VLYFISKIPILFYNILANAVYSIDVIDGDSTKKTRSVFHQQFSFQQKGIHLFSLG